MATPLLGLVLLLTAGQTGAVETSIEDYFGDVKFMHGIKQNIICSVEEPEKYGVISWRLGETLLKPREHCETGKLCPSVEVTGQDNIYGSELYQETLSFVPDIKDDGKDLSCEYSVPGQQVQREARDQIQLLVFKQQFEVVDPEPVSVGQPSIVQVRAVLFPPPKEEDFVWTVMTPASQPVVELSPGGEDEFARYKVHSIQDLGEDHYLLKFTVLSMSREEAENRHSLVISTLEPKKTLDLNIPLLIKETTGGITETRQTLAPELSKDLEDVETSSFGIYIIIGLLLLCLVLCIIFCVIRRRKKKDGQQKAAADGKGAFTVVGSKDSPAQV